MEEFRSGTVSKLIGNCPSCSGLVRLPAEADIDSMVRCPHCGNTFTLKSVLAQIPELEIVEKTPPKIEPLVDRESTPRPTTVVRKKFEVPNQLFAGSKKRRRRRIKHSSDQATSNSSTDVETAEPIQISTSPTSEVALNSFEISTEDSQNAIKREPRAMSSTHAARVRVHSSQRHRRPMQVARDPSFEIAKIVMGGMLAFPIAYLILLWGIGQDPLKLAPSLSKTVPFIVPKKMREAAEKSGDAVKSKRSVAAPRSSTNPRRSSDQAANDDSDVNSSNTESGVVPITVSDILPDLRPEDSGNTPQSIPDVAPDKSESNKR